MSKNLLDCINYPSDLKKLSKDSLSLLSIELREKTIELVSKTGGHLGSSLAVIELTIALHFVFNTPEDILIWDVGHQTYPHKILTGRKDKMYLLRQKDGIAGFTKRSESIYDPFGAGHSSTSISAALGYAMASQLSQKNNKVIAVIGDGAMSAGMAYEALNNVGDLKPENLIIILNDNDMSIANPTGAFSNYLAKLTSSSPFLNFRNKTKEILDFFPDNIKSSFKKAEKTAKRIVQDSFSGNNFFENLDIDYFGPIDGHNVEDLVDILNNLKDSRKPILLHLITKKGKGYSFAENSSDKFHGVSKFDIKTGSQNKKTSAKKSWTKIFSEELLLQAEQDNKIVAITAAMPDGTGLKEFSQKFPENFFDVGIAEQHSVTFAAGLACQGYKPFVVIYSTFLQRAYDQIIHDVAIQNLPVKFAIDRAGLVGADGSTHAGSFDITFLCTLPNFVVMAPSDEQELINMVATATAYNKSPIAFRYPRGECYGLKLKKAEILQIGKAREIVIEKDILILSLGTRLDEIKRTAKKLKENGRNASIIDMRFAKPIDKEIIDKHIKNHSMVVTIEEGSIGGFSAQINDYLNHQGYNKDIIIKNIFLPDIFQNQATQEEMYEQAEMNWKNIYLKIIN